MIQNHMLWLNHDPVATAIFKILSAVILGGILPDE
jgi:hypothetical protein